ncbi:MAG: D-alanyl-D-alanine carboxypeptidase [Clostridia bacterium]|nr:D-alanyl-D-alanine carboxypeptidase [Clostridia bacterium]
MKKILTLFLAVTLTFMSLNVSAFSKNDSKYAADSSFASIDYSGLELDPEIRSAYLIEAGTGDVLYAKNEFKSASPASVTKIMTLLLVAEALKDGRFDLDTIVSVSSHAASMGGSQVFLEEGERISVRDLIKSTVIASANDAAVALAELTAGSESAFVKKMNERASELGLTNTSFENTTGLDDTTTNHYSCAADIGKMSRELIKHDIILEYSSIWQDTIRNGEFTLTNTNRLVRYYDGCNGLKTGSTDKAGYCVSATAKRGNMQLIAVIMGAPSRDARNEAARELLDYGFANFAVYESGESFIESIPVLSGVKDFVPTHSSPFTAVVNKSKLSSVEQIYDIPETLTAPISEGQVVGRIVYKLDGEQLGYSDIYAADSVDEITFFDILIRLLKRMVE